MDYKGTLKTKDLGKFISFDLENSMSGIYLHIPYCAQACHYCDFHFSTRLNSLQEMVEAMEVEIEEQSHTWKLPIKSLYLGGGTPSLLSNLQLGKLLEGIHRHYDLDLEEITLEANPDDLNLKRAQELKSMGFNRLSIGIQSFNDLQLKQLNRKHNSQQALKAVENVRHAGFDNFNLDIMYALPEQSLSDLEQSLDHFIELKPAHLSAYCLSIEPGTVFGQWHRKGKINAHDADSEAEMYELVESKLKAAGYLHYEVSNYALPGKQALHNQNYWRHIPFLGIGPGAHSYSGTSRKINVANNPIYIKKMKEGTLFANWEPLSDAAQINERLLTGLRNEMGVDFIELKNRFAWKPDESQKKLLEEWEKRKMIRLSQEKIYLNQEYWLLADEIVEKLMILEEF